MPATCTACGVTVSKLIQHLQQRLDPQCQRLFASWNSELSDDSYQSGEEEWLSEDSGTPLKHIIPDYTSEQTNKIPVDSNGNLFSDYASYSKADFGWEMDQGEDNVGMEMERPKTKKKRLRRHSVEQRAARSGGT